MIFSVYVIKSQLTCKIYIGQTNNLHKRIIQHNDPNCHLSLYTKYNKGPWKLVYNESFSSRKEAMIRERQLKSSRGRSFIKQQINEGP
jgi:putative endonuclease